MSQFNLDDGDIEIAKQTAEDRIKEKAREITETLITSCLSSLDMVVYTSCGGDPQRLLAESVIENVCLALDQNPIDLLERASKNSMKNQGGLP